MNATEKVAAETVISMQDPSMRLARVIVSDCNESELKHIDASKFWELISPRLKELVSDYISSLSRDEALYDKIAKCFTDGVYDVTDTHEGNNDWYYRVRLVLDALDEQTLKRLNPVKIAEWVEATAFSHADWNIEDLIESEIKAELDYRYEANYSRLKQKGYIQDGASEVDYVRAVQRFQKDNGLEPTGDVNQETSARLFQEEA